MFTFEWKDKPKEKERVKEDGEIEVYSDPARFNGVVTVKIPKHQDRIRFLKELRTSIKDGEATEANLEMSDKLLDYAKSHIEKVDLKRLDDGFEFNSVEQLEYDIHGADVLGDIASVLIQGVRLSKS